MEHIPTAISVIALTVAFIAVAICRRPILEAPKEKKVRKKRPVKDDLQQA